MFRVENPRKQVCTLFVVLTSYCWYSESSECWKRCSSYSPELVFCPSCIEPCDVVFLSACARIWINFLCACTVGGKAGRLPLVLSRTMALSMSVCPLLLCPRLCHRNCLLLLLLCRSCNPLCACVSKHPRKATQSERKRKHNGDSDGMAVESRHHDSNSKDSLPSAFCTLL